LDVTHWKNWIESPRKKAYASQSRKWGIPGEKGFLKEAIMSTSVQKELSNRGLKSTLYDPWVMQNQRLNIPRVEATQMKLESINLLIGFSNIIPKKLKALKNINTKFFRKFNVALSPMYRIFLSASPKVASYPAYQNLTLRKQFTVPFLKYELLKVIVLLR